MKERILTIVLIVLVIIVVLLAYSRLRNILDPDRSGWGPVFNRQVSEEMIEADETEDVDNMEEVDEGTWVPINRQVPDEEETEEFGGWTWGPVGGQVSDQELEVDD